MGRQQEGGMADGQLQWDKGLLIGLCLSEVAGEKFVSSRLIHGHLFFSHWWVTVSRTVPDAV